jgi:hypothetical protein
MATVTPPESPESDPRGVEFLSWMLDMCMYVA